MVWDDKRKTMNSILEAAAEFLRSEELRYGVADDGQTLFVGFTGANFYWNAAISTDSCGNVLSVISRFPLIVPASRRPACCSLLACLNYGRRLGSFHLDLRDGEILFCISSIIGECAPGSATLRALIGTTFAAMEEGGARILELLCGPAAAGAGKSQAWTNLHAPSRFGFN
jgi:hypothetical protein